MRESGHRVTGSSGHPTPPHATPARVGGPGHRKKKGGPVFHTSCCIALILFAGCMHSHVIQVTVTNTSTEKVTTIMIDYPEATFGINSLDPGKSFQYKIKPTATGVLKIEFLNSHGVDRVTTGPVLHKGDEGSIEVKLAQDGATTAAKMK